MSGLSIRNPSGEVLRLADIDENGNVRVLNSVESPLVVRLAEFLFGANLLGLDLLVDGKPQAVPIACVQDIFSAVERAKESLHGRDSVMHPR